MEEARTKFDADVKEGAVRLVRGDSQADPVRTPIGLLVPHQRRLWTEPRASMRACSYHASPGACQASALCISLWMIYVNALVSNYKLSANKAVEKWMIVGHQVASPPLSTG